MHARPKAPVRRRSVLTPKQSSRAVVSKRWARPGCAIVCSARGGRCEAPGAPRVSVASVRRQRQRWQPCSGRRHTNGRGRCRLSRPPGRDVSAQSDPLRSGRRVQGRASASRLVLWRNGARGVPVELDLRCVCGATDPMATAVGASAVHRVRAMASRRDIAGQAALARLWRGRRTQQRRVTWCGRRLP
jgi:hypothetical protein